MCKVQFSTDSKNFDGCSEETFQKYKLFASFFDSEIDVKYIGISFDSIDNFMKKNESLHMNNNDLSTYLKTNIKKIKIARNYKIPRISNANDILKVTNYNYSLIKTCIEELKHAKERYEFKKQESSEDDEDSDSVEEFDEIWDKVCEFKGKCRTKVCCMDIKSKSRMTAKISLMSNICRDYPCSLNINDFKVVEKLNSLLNDALEVIEVKNKIDSFK